VGGGCEGVGGGREGAALGQIAAPMIEFRNVSFRYENSSAYALKNVSLSIPYGQKLSVVGMNGAGKTTLIKLLLRLYAPTEGQILMNGIDIASCPIEQYYGLFSVVFQDYRLLAATIRENITCGNADANGRQAEQTEQADGLLADSLAKSGIYGAVQRLPNGAETQLYRLFDQEGAELSGGEEQRLAISRALYKKAPVIIWDEPTAALDPKTEYEIYASMERIIENKTSIYISHRMTSCIFCDRVAVFHEGELVQYGSHEQLIRQRDKYAQMFAAQAQYYL
jgi:ATP-binding cassette subfamily B protein/ATP-binding cassette subfamily C protein